MGSKFEYFWPDEQGTKYFLIYRISTIRKVQINVQNEGDYGLHILFNNYLFQSIKEYNILYEKYNLNYLGVRNS